MRRPAPLPLLALLMGGTAQAALLEVPAAYPTIQAALDAAAPGDTVEVSNGTYHEFLHFPSGGAPGQPITLAARAGHSPVVDGTGLVTTDAEGLVTIEDVGWVTVRGLELASLDAASPSHFPAGIWVRGTAHDVLLEDNLVRDIRNPGCASCGAHGIAVYGTSASSSVHDVAIRDNEVRDCVLGWSEAVVVNGNVEDFEITGNHVHHNNNIGIDAIGFEGECAGCGDALDQARDGLIAGNLVTDIDSATNPAYGGERSADGIYVDGGTRIVIEGNTVRRCNIGIEIASEHQGKATSEITVRNNFVSASHTIGLAMGGYDTNRGSTRDCVVVHNTLAGNDTDGGGNGEILLQHDTSGNILEDNVVAAGAQARLVTNEFTLNSGNVVDHNLYFAPAGAAATSWSWTGTPYAGFAAWQAGTGNDAASIFADPMLVDAPAGDLHLDPASPAVGAAAPLAPGLAGATDIDGDPRVSGAAADLGADELACGNGSLDGDEQCDDGDLVSGDGCDANCTVTACGNGIATAGEACDDGNVAAGDCCDAACAFEAAGSSCDDDAPCTFADACDGAGLCAGTAAVQPSCLVPEPGSAGSQLKMRGGSGAKDSMQWTWGRGPAAPLAFLGDPAGGDDLRLCVFAGDGSTSLVVLDALAPGGAAWSPSGATGLRYAPDDLAPDGLSQVQFKGGDAGAARVKVKGRGSALALSLPGFGATWTVSAQLRNEATGACFGAAYAAPFRRDEAGRFQDKSD